MSDDITAVLAHEARWALVEGDNRDVLPTLADNSIDAIVTDPPYALTQGSRGGSPRINNPETPYGRTNIGAKGFMGKQWDNGDVAFDPAFWRECLRVLKPGGHLLAFGGTRTVHRLVCAIEDAGAEIRDTAYLLFVHGQGFPKSRNLDGAWQGWGTALKPAVEPIVVARKPLDGTVAGNVQKWGVGALNIDATRIHTAGSEAKAYSVTRLKPGATLNATGGNWRPDEGPRYEGTTTAGRWPTNLLLQHSPECGDECSPSCPVALLDQQAGPRTSGTMKAGTPRRNRAGYTGPMPSETLQETYGDSGNASRFFPTFTPDPADAVPFLYTPKPSRAERGDGNTHPTVKSISLCRWLAKLICPPGGAVLDPFAGSGSTGLGALAEGFRFIGIEREPEYVEIARRRLEAAPVRLPFDEKAV